VLPKVPVPKNFEDLLFRIDEELYKGSKPFSALFGVTAQKFIGEIYAQFILYFRNFIYFSFLASTP